MKYVDVNPLFYPFKGGIEHRMHDLARLLTEKGHDVTIVTSRLPDTEEEEIAAEGYRIIRLKSRFIDVYNPPFISSKGVLETLDSLDADVVNYNYRWAPSYNKALRRYDGPKTFTYHNMWGEGVGAQAWMSDINDNRFRKTLDTFDHVFCVSNNMREDLERRGIPKTKTSVFPPLLTEYPDVRDEEGDFLLSLGRLVKIKGIGYLIDAMKDVDCKLYICGKGPEYDRLRKRISKNGLDDRIEMKGFVSEEEKYRLMSTCKAFVMPSLSEAFGLAAAELMSYGRPIVSSNVGGLPETVGDGGITVPPKDSAALSEAINRLLSDDDLRRDMGRRARAHAETHDWSKRIDEMESMLLSISKRN